MVHLHRFVVELGLQLLGISHFPDSFHEIFLNYEVMIGTDRKHPCEGGFHRVKAEHKSFTQILMKTDPGYSIYTSFPCLGCWEEQGVHLSELGDYYKENLFKLCVTQPARAGKPPSAQILMWKKDKIASTLKALGYQDPELSPKRRKMGTITVSGSHETLGHLTISQQVAGSDQLKRNVPAEHF